MVVSEAIQNAYGAALNGNKAVLAGEIMRPRALESRLLRRAAQVQARSQQLAAGEGKGVHVLLLTHTRRLAGRPNDAQCRAGSLA
jgi:hypothetical protein